mmetsp:Transcript_35235/g.75042  ORF Transcript_35235/g.75042 Transcript_35235/m.75042 type:complete len:577 (+) Transcript_35235:279-2009(+)
MHSESAGMPALAASLGHSGAPLVAVEGSRPASAEGSSVSRNCHSQMEEQSGGDSPGSFQVPIQMTLCSRLEEEFGVDSWRLRSKPEHSAPPVGIVRIRQVINVVGLSSNKEWLEVEPFSGVHSSYSGKVWARRRFGYKGQRYEAFVPAGVPEYAASPALVLGSDGSGKSASERVQALLSELACQRRLYEHLATLPPTPETASEQARTARVLEDILSRLDFLGIKREEALAHSLEDAMALELFSRTQSFEHRDFANPQAETCWLSCLFQALWHSVVFHTAFDRYLSPARCQPGPNEKILQALQRTWALYSAEQAALAKDQAMSSASLVPAEDLVDAFGDGYGDMSEALASIQTELSDSPNPAAKAIADQIVLIPLATLSDSCPRPIMAWHQAEEWQVTKAPLIAVDLSLPSLTRNSCRLVAKLWLPRLAGRRREDKGSSSDETSEDEENANPEVDLGTSHRLVAMVCYMHAFRHYVVFCRRQRAPDRCLLFNDLPGLTRGMPRELEWRQVPEACYLYSLTPRLVLYESVDAAQEVARKRVGASLAPLKNSPPKRLKAADGSGLNRGEGKPDAGCTHQ